MPDTTTPAILGGAPIRPQGPPAWPIDDPQITQAATACLAGGAWGKYTGPHHDALVETLSAYHAAAHAIPCASGTVAVELALRGLRVGPGDEVVMAAYDFKANFQNVLLVGATPVLVDVLPGNWNINVDLLEAAFSEQTKAILVSHLHGGIVPMPRVMEIARRHDLPVIEDACQMPGAHIHGRVAGTTGDVGVLSFGGSKLLTAGRGGAVLTDRDDVVQRIRLYTQRGNEAYPLSELQAAVLLPQLEKLDARNALRANNVQALCRLLEQQPGLCPFRNTVDSADDDSRPGYYKVGLQYDAEQFGGIPRELFSTALRAEGIAIDPGFRALHATHSRRRFRAADELTQATAADTGVLTLHHPVLLEDEAAIKQIAAALDRIRQHATMIIEQTTTND